MRNQGLLTLRSAEPSPFGRKVRIAAAMLGLDDRIAIEAADTINPDPALLHQNPLGKIPALILPNGDALYDSAVIVEYLDWLAGGGKIIPIEPEARFRSLTGQALADGIMEAAILLRYEALWRDVQHRSDAWTAHQQGKIDRGLEAFEASAPEEISDIATIALACALGYLDLRFGGEWRPKHPDLVRWQESFAEAEPSFEGTRFKG
jgi:glutathione S-transferase